MPHRAVATPFAPVTPAAALRAVPRLVLGGRWAALTRCAGTDARQADADRNRGSRARAARIVAANRARRRTAHRAWCSFRDTAGRCATGGGASEGGTIWPMLVDPCLARLTRARTQALPASRNGPGWDWTCPGG